MMGRMQWVLRYESLFFQTMIIKTNIESATAKAVCENKN